MLLSPVIYYIWIGIQLSPDPQKPNTKAFVCVCVSNGRLNWNDKKKYFCGFANCFGALLLTELFSPFICIIVACSQ